MPLTPGDRLGPYEIVRLVGRGGMGEVYQARDTRLHRTIAIKVLHREVAADPDRLQRFEHEAQAASALNHPIATLNPDVPAHLALVVHRCLDKDPANRYESTRDLAHDLRHVAESGATQVSAVTPTPPQARRRLPVAIGAALVLVGLLAAGWVWLRRQPSSTAPPQPLIAVRAFRNVTQDASQNYFADGVTDEIRGQLSKIAALRVLSRSAVDKYGDGDGRKMAQELGVASIVEGSVRLERNRVRIAVELVDAATLQTRWSEQYERDVSDAFSVQSDVALRVAQTLAANLSTDERQRVERRPTQNLEAYQLYLRSQALTALADRQKNLEGIELLKQALVLDPSFAVAKARLAYRVFFRAYIEDPAFADQGIALATEAAQLDPTLAAAHFVLGSAYGLKGQTERSRSSFLRALELDPSHVGSMLNLSFVNAITGNLEGVYWARRAFPLSAKAGNEYYHVAVPLISLRDDELTWRWLAAAERQFPDFSRTPLMVAAAEVLRGDGAGALIRVRAAAFPTNSEVTLTLADLAIIMNAEDAEALSEAMLRATPDVGGFLLPETGRLRYAYALNKRGDTSRAKRLLVEAESRARQRVAAGDVAPPIFLELAAARAMQGDTKGAIAELQRAYDSGWRDYGPGLVDPMLATIRDEPGFRAVIDRAIRDVAAQRQRARERGLMDLESLIGRSLP